MVPRSAGKDSTTGHWEIAGVHLERPFPTYPHGFPAEVVEEFARRTHRSVIGNVVGSGTAIIDRYGDEHARTGAWILYTSADSVFQVAANEQVVPLAELHAACQTARAMLVAPNDVSRVIARPFVGSNGSFTRTANRRDFSIPPRNRATGIPPRKSARPGRRRFLLSPRLSFNRARVSGKRLRRRRFSPSTTPGSTQPCSTPGSASMTDI